MLYDPKWEVKADPFSLGALIAWLEVHPAERAYDFNNCHGACLLCQYLTSAGIDWARYGDLFDGDTRREIAATLPRTFGGALERARALVK